MIQSKFLLDIKDPMDVHIFDGQLLYSKSLILPHLQIAALVSNEDKLAAFGQLKLQLDPNPNFDTIVNDFMSIGHSPGPNYDPTNELYADDLLYLCACLVQKMPLNETLIFLLNEQLVQMSTGMCPQGRTHRLMQIIMTFEQFL